MDIKIVGWDELPPHMKHDADHSALYTLIYSADGTLLDYFNNKENYFNELSAWVKKAYEIGRGEFSPNKPQKRSLVFIAHNMAEVYRRQESDNSIDTRFFIKEARKWDEVSRRFSGGLEIHPVFDETGIVVAYKVRGESGYTYSVNATIDVCSCEAGLAGKDCWHLAAVDVYAKAVKAIS